MSHGLAELTAHAKDLIGAGDLGSAQMLLSDALATVDVDPLRASPDLADAAGLLARILVALGEPHSARAWSTFAHTAQRRLHGPADERTVVAAATLAAVLHRVGAFAGAAHLYRDVVARLTLVDGPGSMRVLAAQADLATVEHARGECVTARKLLADAYRRHRETYGEGHPAGIKMLARLGTMERDCGNFGEAHRLFSGARDLCRDYLPADHPMAAQIAAIARAGANPDHVCHNLSPADDDFSADPETPQPDHVGTPESPDPPAVSTPPDPHPGTADAPDAAHPAPTPAAATTPATAVPHPDLTPGAGTADPQAADRDESLATGAADLAGGSTGTPWGTVPQRSPRASPWASEPAREAEPAANTGPDLQPDHRTTPIPAPSYPGPAEDDDFDDFPPDVDDLGADQDVDWEPRRAAPGAPDVRHVEAAGPLPSGVDRPEQAAPPAEHDDEADTRQRDEPGARNDDQADPWQHAEPGRWSDDEPGIGEHDDRVHAQAHPDSRTDRGLSEDEDPAWIGDAATSGEPAEAERRPADDHLPEPGPMQDPGDDLTPATSDDVPADGPVEGHVDNVETAASDSAHDEVTGPATDDAELRTDDESLPAPDPVPDGGDEPALTTDAETPHEDVPAAEAPAADAEGTAGGSERPGVPWQDFDLGWHTPLVDRDPESWHTPQPDPAGSALSAEGEPVVGPWHPPLQAGEHVEPWRAVSFYAGHELRDRAAGAAAWGPDGEPLPGGVWPPSPRDGHDQPPVAPDPWQPPAASPSEPWQPPAAPGPSEPWPRDSQSDSGARPWTPPEQQSPPPAPAPRWPASGIPKSTPWVSSAGAEPVDVDPRGDGEADPAFGDWPLDQPPAWQPPEASGAWSSAPPPVAPEQPAQVPPQGRAGRYATPPTPMSSYDERVSWAGEGAAAPLPPAVFDDLAGPPAPAAGTPAVAQPRLPVQADPRPADPEPADPGLADPGLSDPGPAAQEQRGYEQRQAQREQPWRTQARGVRTPPPGGRYSPLAPGYGQMGQPQIKAHRRTQGDRSLTAGPAPIQQQPGMLVPTRRPVGAVPERYPERPIGKLLAAMIVVGLGTIVVIGGFLLTERDTDQTPPPQTPAATTPGPDGATPPPAEAPARAAGGPPTGLTIEDSRTQLALTWAYPENAEGPVLLNGGRKGQPPQLITELPSGTERFAMNVNNPDADYCFTVAVVYSTSSVEKSAEACTTR